MRFSKLKNDDHHHHHSKMATMNNALRRTRLQPSTIVLQHHFSSYRCIVSHKTDKPYIFYKSAFRRSLRTPSSITCCSHNRRLLSGGISYNAQEETTVISKELKMELLGKYVDENVHAIITKYDGMVESVVSTSKHGPNPLETRNNHTLRQRWQQELERIQNADDHSLFFSNENHNASTFGQLEQVVSSSSSSSPTGSTITSTESINGPFHMSAKEDEFWNSSSLSSSRVRTSTTGGWWWDESPSQLQTTTTSDVFADNSDEVVPDSPQFTMDALNLDIVNLSASLEGRDISSAAGPCTRLADDETSGVVDPKHEPHGEEDILERWIKSTAASYQSNSTIESDATNSIRTFDSKMMHPLDPNNDANDDSSLRRKHQAMALLSVMHSEGWSMYGNHKYDLEMHELANEGVEAEGDGSAPSSLNGIAGINDDDVEPDDSQLLTIESLLHDAESGDIALTREDYNLILLTLATSTSSFHHRMVDMMMNAYMQLKELSEAGEGLQPPNTHTYNILLKVLESRGHCRDGALDICRHITENPKIRTPDLITKVLQCYERNNKPILGQQFLQQVVAEQKGHASTDAFLSQVRAFKRANMIEEAMELLDVCVKVNGYKDSRGVDHVVLELLRWRDGASNFPNRTVVHAVWDKINSYVKTSNYYPGWKVWKQVSLLLGKLAQRDPNADWDPVRQSINTLLQDSGYSPQLDILSIGLATSEALCDGQLAVNLLQKINAADSRRGFQSLFENVSSTEPTLRRHETTVPAEAFRKAIDICISAGDINNGFVLLDQVSYSIPDSGQAEFHAIMIRGCVANKSPESASKVISRMRERGFLTCEEDYGTVMAGFVKAGKRDKALQIMESMKSGAFGDGVVPGVTVYNAVLLSHVAAGEWSEALAVYDAIRDLGIAPDKTTTQGLLIASSRLGDKPRTLALARELFESSVSMDKQCYEHCLKILLPKQVRANSVAEVRKKLRVYGIQNARFKDVTTSLSRSLRIAEVEEERQVTERLSELDLNERREKAWRDVLDDMLEFSQQQLLQDEQELPPSQSAGDSQATNESIKETATTCDHV